MLILDNSDWIAEHTFAIEQVLAGLADGAFLPPEERDRFKLVPKLVVFAKLMVYQCLTIYLHYYVFYSFHFGRFEAMCHADLYIVIEWIFLS